MDDPTYLPAVIVRFDHPKRALPLYLLSRGFTEFPERATRYATEGEARRAMRTAIRDLRMDTWTPSLETA
jgi:hypothetical protein